MLVHMHYASTGGDFRAGMTAAVREVAAEYELYSLNSVLGELVTFGPCATPSTIRCTCIAAGGAAPAASCDPVGKRSTTASLSTSAPISSSTVR